MLKKLLAEFVGTFWLVFAGCGSAVLAAAFHGEASNLGIGLVGVSLAFGLTVLTMAYAVGHVSGGHFNPAVTLGLVAGGRFSFSEAPAYIATQVVAGIAAGAMLLFIASGQPDFVAGGFASNGFGELSPGGFSMMSVAAMEVVMTAIFLYVIMGSTHRNAPVGFAPLAIGLCLALIHLVSIPVSNTSVNPARSLGVALFADTEAMSQVWLFWVAPIIGGVIGAVLYNLTSSND